MADLLETEPHGRVIRAGFDGGYMPSIVLGRYSLSTRDFCALMTVLADNPTLKSGSLLAYSEARIAVKRAQLLDELARMSLGEVLSPQLGQRMAERFIAAQREDSIEDTFDLGGEGEIIPVSITKADTSVSIGEYAFAAARFRSFAAYVAAGGFRRDWGGGTIPDFAVKAQAAMQASQRPLFRST